MIKIFRWKSIIFQNNDYFKINDEIILRLVKKEIEELKKLKNLK